MAKKKYYVVKKGKTPGIYSSWDECRAQVEGYSGALYKGFAAKEEAQAYLQGNVQEGEAEEVPDRTEEMISGTEEFPGEEDISEAEEIFGEEDISGAAEVPETDEGEAVAYVDGSYRKETGEYSCGVVFFSRGRKTELSIRGDDETLAAMHNVAGEIMGARMAMEEAVRLGIRKLIIFHDYQGIASWCLGEWQTNKEGTIAYKKYYDSLQGLLEISFQKVKGHSGDVWNDRADELAGQALL